MKLISFCLWGENPKYNVGAIKNIDLAKRFYPDWVCRFYCDSTVPSRTKKIIKSNKNCQLVEVDKIGDWTFTINRFLPLSENGVDCVISRDTDSRISERESTAVAEWIKSGKSAHIMRDHPYHGGFPMLAGMFGINSGVVKNIKALLSIYQNHEQYHYDQFFLANFIYPLIEDNVLIHDEFFEKNSFPTARVGLEFVGEVYDDQCMPNQEHREILRKGILQI